MISLCLDQSTLIVETADGARGSTKHSQEKITMPMQDPMLSILNVIVSSCHQSTKYMSVDLQVISESGEFFFTFLFKKK